MQRVILELPYKRLLELDDTAPLTRHRRRWVDEGAGIITSWEGFERYPWPRVSDIDLYPMESRPSIYPKGWPSSPASVALWNR
jgi:uroporphyrinogen decarboxylase